LAQNRGFTHIEFDGEGRRDVVDEMNLRREWEALLSGDSGLFLGIMAESTVVTIPSMRVFINRHADLVKVRIRYLMGPA